MLCRKLTKKFFMQLPEGVFLVSNVFHNPTTTVFAEEVSPVSERSAQWDRIVSAGADQRGCRVFKSRIEFETWLALAYKNQFIARTH